jgi:hypothetical protein
LYSSTEAIHTTWDSTTSRPQLESKRTSSQRAVCLRMSVSSGLPRHTLTTTINHTILPVQLVLSTILYLLYARQGPQKPPDKASLLWVCRIIISYCWTEACLSWDLGTCILACAISAPMCAEADYTPWVSSISARLWRTSSSPGP